MNYFVETWKMSFFGRIWTKYYFSETSGGLCYIWDKKILSRSGEKTDARVQIEPNKDRTKKEYFLILQRHENKSAKIRIFCENASYCMSHTIAPNPWNIYFGVLGYRYWFIKRTSEIFKAIDEIYLTKRLTGEITFDILGGQHFYDVDFHRI